MAQQALMILRVLEISFFGCVPLITKNEKRHASFGKLMSKTDKVEIKGPGVDLSFSIKGSVRLLAVGQYS